MIFLLLALGIGGAGLVSEIQIGGEFHADSGFQSTLDEEASAFARAWTEKNVGALRDRLDGSGIRLHLPDEEHLLIRPRQAQAALDKFLNRYVGGEALLSRVSLAGDDGQMGFAEIRWETTSPGLSGTVTFTVFLGYALNDERWTVTEIRVLL